MNFTPEANDQFLILANDGTDPVVGTFAGLPQGGVLQARGDFLQIDYHGGDGNDVVLRPIQPVAPTISANGRTATYTDEDGDLVTVRTSRGSFASENFVFRPAGTHGEQQLQLLDLTTTAADFTNANITLTARITAGAGNALANLGVIRAPGVDLGNINIAGDLGHLEAASVKAMTVQSVGAFGLETQAFFSATLFSTLPGNLARLTVKTDIHDAKIIVGGSIGPVTVRGSFVGGQLSAGTALGAVNIHGDIVGTAAAPVVISAFGKAVAPASGRDTAITSFTVGGGVEFLRLLGGYDPSGVAKNSDASIGAITVGADWRASTVLAGVEAGADRFDGSADDRTITGGTRNNANIVAQIGAIVIRGQALGTATSSTDNFGIVAEQIASARIGANRFTFATGPQSAADFFLISSTAAGAPGEVSDFNILESVL